MLKVLSHKESCVWECDCLTHMSVSRWDWQRSCASVNLTGRWLTGELEVDTLSWLIVIVPSTALVDGLDATFSKVLPLIVCHGALVSGVLFPFSLVCVCILFWHFVLLATCVSAQCGCRRGCSVVYLSWFHHHSSADHCISLSGKTGFFDRYISLAYLKPLLIEYLFIP